MGWSLWRWRIRPQRDAYSCSVSIKTIKDTTVSLMILNGELSDWYFVFVFPIGIGQLAKDVAIGEDAFKNRENKPLDVIELYHTIATALHGAGCHSRPVPIRSQWGRPPC